MEQKLGYSLLDAENNEIQFWNYDPAPNPIILPNGDHIHAPELNVSYSGYRLVERWQISDETTGLFEIGQSKSFDGIKFIITKEYRRPNKPELIQYSASVRYDKEVSGITVSNNFIFTDRQSQAMINGIVTMVQLQPDVVINFKTGSGFIEANLQIIMNIATSVASHIQTCFSMEADIVKQIQANTITQFTEIDTFFDINKQ